LSRLSRVTCRPVQPRARGKHVARKLRRRFLRGSAPRTRETLFTTPRVAPTTRFSPAHAGNTPNCLTRLAGQSVQPRARGKHAVAEYIAARSYGSAPRTRETPVIAARLALDFRFSPAHAGNTARHLCLWRDDTVQPRARGKH